MSNTLYVVVNRNRPNQVIGVFFDAKVAKGIAKAYRYETKSSDLPWIWEVNTNKTYFDRLPREVC
jgi:hypothetical protein